MRWWNLGVVAVTLALSGCGADSASTDPGEQVYNRYCFSCHAAGVAGAPRTGDIGAWAPRIAKGPEALLATTITGIAPGMPARGLCSECTDEQLAAAIEYMIVRSVAESQ